MPQNINASTQDLVTLKDIRDGILYLKDGGLRQILLVGGVNFDLKSEEEQGLILGSFQNFLNALDFPVQFFVHSRKVDVRGYLEKIRARKDKERSELLKIQIEEYVTFVHSFVEENAIIHKAFFVIVPYDPVTLSGQTKGILSMFRRGKDDKEAKQKSNQENLEQLNIRVTKVVNGIEQIGLRVAPLSNEEAVELFYNLFNPSLIEKKDLAIAEEQQR